MKVRHVFTLAPRLILLAWAHVVLAPAAQSQSAFYVAVGGEDRSAGTVKRPFATLARARDAVRQLPAPRRATVYLRGGLYPVRDTVVFDHRDSGAADRPVVYQAYPGERPVLSGGIEVTGWTKLSNSVHGLPAEAARHVWVAPMPLLHHSGRFFTMFDGHGMLPRARTRGFLPEPGGVGDRLQAHFPAGAIRNWPNLQDVELVIRPEQVWTMNILGLAAVDESRCLARTTIPGTYPLIRLGRMFAVPDGMPSAWIENVPEGLDSPGEWMANTREGLVYLWPRGARPEGIRVAGLRELVRLEGNEETGQLVRHIVFRGLTFTHGDRDVWTAEDIGLQHDWDLWNKDNALVRMRGAEDCAVEHCLFTQTGGGGVRLDLHCRRNRVAANELVHFGGTGILAAGYGPGTRDVNGDNEIVNNRIHHGGELYWHSPGIFLWQSGRNRVAHNEIHHFGYNGLVISGVRAGSFRNREGKGREVDPTLRWAEIGALQFFEPPNSSRPERETLPYLHGRDNLVEYNDIYRVMERLGDGNGIYVSGAGHGNIIRQNAVHDLYGTGVNSAIRTDGWQEGTLIAENVVYNCVGGGITLKQVNRVENNIVANLILVSPLEQIEPDFRGEPLKLAGYILLRRGPSAGSTLQRNLLVHPGKQLSLYDEARIKRFVPAYARDCQTDYNLYWFADDPAAADRFLEAKRAEGIDKHSIAADPLFRDLRNNDFRLPVNSPARLLGFAPIHQDRIGIERGVKPGPEGLRTGGTQP